MNDTDRDAFVGAYTKVLANAWSDESYLQRLHSDPKAAVAENGLDVPEGSTVTIADSVGTEGSLDDQVALWNIGKETGDYRLYVPSKPKVDVSELSEGQAEAADTYCCCCTPCCTCT